MVASGQWGAIVIICFRVRSKLSSLLTSHPERYRHGRDLSFPQLKLGEATAAHGTIRDVAVWQIKASLCFGHTYEHCR